LVIGEAHAFQPTSNPISHHSFKLRETLASSPIVYVAENEYKSDDSDRLRTTKSGNRSGAGSFDAPEETSTLGLTSVNFFAIFSLRAGIVL